MTKRTLPEPPLSVDYSSVEDRAAFWEASAISWKLWPWRKPTRKERRLAAQLKRVRPVLNPTWKRKGYAYDQTR